MSTAPAPLAMVAETLVSAGEQYSLDARCLRDLCVKMVVLSLTYVDRQAVWAQVFPDGFVDWALVRPSVNTLGDLNLWLPLLELFAWEGVERLEPHHPPLASMRRAMRAAHIDPGTWDLPCQLLVLQMLQGVPCLQAFQLMTCRALRRDTHQSCALLASLSDTPFPPRSAPPPSPPSSPPPTPASTSPPSSSTSAPPPPAAPPSPPPSSSAP